MCAAARRRSGPRLRKAWTIRLHLSARHDFALQMDARESVIEITRAALGERGRAASRLLRNGASHPRYATGGGSGGFGGLEAFGGKRLGRARPRTRNDSS